MDFPAIFGALCAPAALRPLGDVPLLGLFLAGLSGSVLHCAPMCGPFVLGQAAARMARMPAARLCELRRLQGAALLPYHLGRLTTYAGLGALAGGIGVGLGQLAWFAPLSGVLLILAALLFLLHAARGLSVAVARVLPGLDPAPSMLTRLLGRLTGTQAGLQGYRLGVLLGFLPCGLLYTALMVAAAGQSVPGGALAMLAFGLGTVPALVGIAILGNGALGIGWGRLAGLDRLHGRPRLAPAILLANSAVLALLAWQRLAS
jgi:sulfite exporter TauE/SafE